ncbi:hypothetical protein ACTA71_008047 [Dictyostelium dimigraforme]
MNIRNTLVLLISTLLGLILNSNSCHASVSPYCVGAPTGQVHLFTHWDFQGQRFIYNITQGQITLPIPFMHNVESFTSGSVVCFASCDPMESYEVDDGESHRNYAALTNFGQRMTIIVPGNCSNIICPSKLNTLNI